MKQTHYKSKKNSWNSSILKRTSLLRTVSSLLLIILYYLTSCILFVKVYSLCFIITATPSTSASTSSISNMANGKEKVLPSFWVPSQAPSAKKTKVQKPDSTILCPVSQKPIKAKDLIDVKFTLVQDPDDKKSLIVKENRYMCAVTHDILSNSVPCAVLRPTYVWIIL